MDPETPWGGLAPSLQPHSLRDRPALSVSTQGTREWEAAGLPGLWTPPPATTLWVPDRGPPEPGCPQQ